MGCTEKNLLENGDAGNPSFAATGTSGSLSVNLDQFANGDAAAKKDPQWQNGDLNGQNSHYPPDGSVPFRLSIDGLNPGTHSIHLNYDWTAGSHHAYDFLATIDAFIKESDGLNVCEPNGGNGAVPSPWCQKVGTVYSLKSGANGNSSIFSFGNAGDNFSNDGLTSAGAFGASSQLSNSEVVGDLGLTDDPAHGSLILIGGTINSISDPADGHEGNVDGNSTGDVVVTFTIPTGACTVKPCAVLLLWSGHLADDQGSNAFWNQAATPAGPADGVSEISGAPWHMRSLNMVTDIGTPQEKVNGNKNQDRSIQPSAIIAEVPLLSITKEPDDGDAGSTVNAGSNISFTIVVTNDGPGTATSVVLTDTLPKATGVNWTTSTSGCTISDITVNSETRQELVCNAGDLADGAQFSATVTSSTTAATCAVLPNLAHAAGGNTGNTPSDGGQITVECPSLSITKEPDAGDAGSSVDAGDPISFSITVSNTGAGDATGVVLTDTLPAGPGIDWSTTTSGCVINSITVGSDTREELVCTIGTLAGTTPGPAGSFTATVTSNTTAASCVVLNNKAWADGTNTDPVSDTGQITVSCPSLTVAKEPDDGDTGSEVTAGDPISFSITVSNTGAGDADNVVLTDTLPAGNGIDWNESNASCVINAITVSGVAREELVCTIGTLAGTDPGPAGSFTVTVTSSTTETSCAVLSNKAWADGSNTDPTSDTGQITISGCTRGQITPTQTDCSAFNAGTSADLNAIEAGIKAHVINNVAPGVLFYFFSVLSPSAGAFTIDAVQTNDGPAGWPNFQVQQGQAFIFNASCVRLSPDGVLSGGDTQVQFSVSAGNNPAAGTKFIIGVKYTPSSVVGQPDTPLITGDDKVIYTFNTVLNKGTGSETTLSDNTDTVDLVKKGGP